MKQKINPKKIDCTTCINTPIDVNTLAKYLQGYYSEFTQILVKGFY